MINLIYFCLLILISNGCQYLSKGTHPEVDKMTTPSLWTLIHQEKLKFDLPSGETFLSAASGLALIDSRFYVIADNDLRLGIFSPTPNQNLNQLVPLLDGTLPKKKKELKKQKPDFEALFVLNDSRLPTQGLVAFPSGSTPQRFTGVFIPFLKVHTVDVPHLIRFDLTPIFNLILAQTGFLNIEGVLVDDDKILLFHRGNEKNDTNRLIEISKTDLIDTILKKAQKPPTLQKVSQLEIGKLKNVPLTISDVTLFEGRRFFLAGAEDTQNSYDDGKVKGTVFGELLNSGKTTILGHIENQKLEGLAMNRIDKAILVYAVTDNDDPDQASELLTFRLN
jgi:hypothetical protein